MPYNGILFINKLEFFSHVLTNFYFIKKILSSFCTHFFLVSNISRTLHSLFLMWGTGFLITHSMQSVKICEKLHGKTIIKTYSTAVLRSAFHLWYSWLLVWVLWVLSLAECETTLALNIEWLISLKQNGITEIWELRTAE